ncbi:MAG: chalcone isomerase family protein [Mariprofundus sp.]|nr:chalcone isomerase family protein [Mariprofundus sp.]
MKRILLFALLMMSSPAWAVELEGVSVPDRATVAGEQLQLNGAGIRSKFFFDIYIGALYLRSSATSAQEATAGALPKRVTMDILYDEVDQEKLTGGWTAGFKKNQSTETFSTLEERLHQFNAMFVDAHAGDHFIFDFLRDGSTQVMLRGRDAGRISGYDFQQALLAVWLGKKPADNDLKQAMLHGH